MPTPIDQLNIEITSDATSAEASLSKLATTLGTLKSACSGGLGLNAVTTNLRTLSTAVNSISSTDNLRKLADALRDIGSAGASTGSLSSIAKQLGSIPKSLTDLGKIDLNAFKDSIKSISDALDPLITKLNSLASNTGAITALQQLARMGGSSGSGSSGGSRGGLFGSLLTAGAGAASIHHITGMIQGLSKPLAECIEKANSYVEALNLFTVALGSYASRAQEYAEYVSAKVGIDPADWLKAEGTFMTLIEGFGVMEDRAYTMSQNLTQLGYDLASFFNISVQDAMTKVQSGISGELEPLRRLGFDLSQTRLKAEALALGITESFNNMTQ